MHNYQVANGDNLMKCCEDNPLCFSCFAYNVENAFEFKDGYKRYIVEYLHTVKGKEQKELDVDYFPDSLTFNEDNVLDILYQRHPNFKDIDIIETKILEIAG